jgi:hypothetical protein
MIALTPSLQPQCVFYHDTPEHEEVNTRSVVRVTQYFALCARACRGVTTHAATRPQGGVH